MRFRGWIPLVLLAGLICAVGAYTAVRQDAFLTQYNIGNLLLTTMPLALVAMGQTVALLVRGFDVSVAALMTMVREQDAFFVIGVILDYVLTFWSERSHHDALRPAARLQGVLAACASFAVVFIPQLWAYMILNGRPGPARVIADIGPPSKEVRV